MLLPTSVFDFLEDVDDYYSPILTGNYLRLLRNAILLMTLFITPFYLLITEYPETLPEHLKSVSYTHLNLLQDPHINFHQY